jgi:glycosyltransferase involved in cell wall biosynthesis
MSPRVTILMPVFNALPYLKDAVKSIQGQTFEDFVCLAIDDGSSDGSVDYLQSVGDPRIQVLADGLHRGMGAALNLGFSRTTTEYVARMDGDDLCSRDRLALQVAMLDRNKTIGVVGTQFTYFGNKGKKGFARQLPTEHLSIVAGLNKGVLSLIHGSLMMRTERFREVGGYRFAGIGEDWDLFLRLAEITQFANVPQVAYFYRLHGKNATSLHRRLTQTRIRYACRCADARRRGLPEPTEDEYRKEMEDQSWLLQLASEVDAFSVSRYYTGRNYVLNGRPATGYINLALAAVASPQRVVLRLNNYLKRDIMP